MEKSLGIKSRTVVEEKKRKKKAGISKVMDASFSSSIVHAIGWFTQDSVECHSQKWFSQTYPQRSTSRPALVYCANKGIGLRNSESELIHKRLSLCAFI